MSTNVSPWQSLLAGTISGMTAISVCHPFDVVRTRLQIHPEMTFQQAAAGGIRGLYDGFQTPFLAQGVYKAIIFTSNTLVIREVFHGQRNQTSVFISGSVAGTVNALAVAPVEMIRTTQIVRNNEAQNILTTLKEMVKDKGLLGPWRAALPTVFRDGPGMGLYFLAFDRTKQWLSSSSTSQSSDSIIPYPSSLLQKVISGAAAGVAYWTWAIPVDTVKSIIEFRFQARGEMRAKVSWAEIAARSLRSLPIAYLRGIPSAAVTLTTYDLVVDALVDKESK